MHFNLCIPRFMKMSVAQQQFRRATALYSNREARERSHEKIRKLLRGNNFPEKEILEAEQRSLQSVGEKKKESQSHTAPAVLLGRTGQENLKPCPTFKAPISSVLPTRH